MNDRSRNANPRFRRRWWETATEFTSLDSPPEMASPFDPLGSYTGAPLDDDEEPIQDADDI